MLINVIRVINRLRLNEETSKTVFDLSRDPQLGYDQHRCLLEILTWLKSNVLHEFAPLQYPSPTPLTVLVQAYGPRREGKLQAITSDYPNQLIGMDLLEMAKSKRGYRYV